MIPPDHVLVIFWVIFWVGLLFVLFLEVGEADAGPEDKSG